jgi:hypothetical protein
VWLTVVLTLVAVGVYLADPLTAVRPSGAEPAQTALERGETVSTLTFVPGGSVSVTYTPEAFMAGDCVAHNMTNGHETGTFSWTDATLPDGARIVCPLS